MAKLRRTELGLLEDFTTDVLEDAEVTKKELLSAYEVTEIVSIVCSVVKVLGPLCAALETIGAVGVAEDLEGGSDLFDEE